VKGNLSHQKVKTGASRTRENVAVKQQEKKMLCDSLFSWGAPFSQNVIDIALTHLGMNALTLTTKASVFKVAVNVSQCSPTLIDQKTQSYSIGNVVCIH
jgi:hypothetical protein